MSDRVSVYVDVSNLAMNGGFGMRYDVLRRFAGRGDAEMVHMNAYIGYDRDRARSDGAYFQSQSRFHSALRDQGFKVLLKDVKHFLDDEGKPYSKSNVDLDMAVDILMQACRMDRIVVCTGDGDFVSVVRAAQSYGCKVECVAFDNVSHELRNEVDMYMSGYLIPGLMQCDEGRFRGLCYAHQGPFGFFRCMRCIPIDILETDSRSPESPYQSVHFTDDKLPPDADARCLPNRSSIFEFGMECSVEGKMEAYDIVLITKGA